MNYTLDDGRSKITDGNYRHYTNIGCYTEIFRSYYLFRDVLNQKYGDNACQIRDCAPYITDGSINYYQPKTSSVWIRKDISDADICEARTVAHLS